MPIQRLPNPLCGKEALNKEFLIEFDQNVVVPGCGEVVWEIDNPVEKLVGALSINDTHQPLRF